MSRALGARVSTSDPGGSVAKAGRQSVRWLLAELLVVVVGILIAFQIDEWSSARIERRQEVASLQAILRDLEIGERELQLYVESAQDRHEHYLELLAFLQDPSRRSAEDITRVVETPSDRLWEPTATAFNSLRDTGRLDLIEDPELQYELLRYFDTFEPYFLTNRLFVSEQWGDFLTMRDGDFDIVPDVDYATSLQVRRELRVAPEIWPTDPKFAEALLLLDRSTVRARVLAESGIERLVELRQRIDRHLGSR